MISLRINGIGAARRRLADTSGRIQAKTTSAIEFAGKLVAKLSRKPLPVARQIGRQDADAPRKLSRANPIVLRVRIAAGTAFVGLSAFYAGVRNRGGGLKTDVTRFLSEDEYTRQTLKIERPRGRRLDLRQPIESFDIATAWGGRLAAWASRADRGQQRYRYVAQITRPEVLSAMSFDPALREAMPIIDLRVRKAVREAIDP